MVKGADFMKYKGLTFAIPKEILIGEHRVAATPETANLLIKKGARVLVETTAGEGSFFGDNKYKTVGAEIIDDPVTLFKLADIILKVKEPRFNEKLNKHEIDLMDKGKCLICFLHPAAPSNKNMVKQLAAKGVLALTLDSIPRVSRAQAMDALTSMSTVAGYKGLLMAANRLPRFLPMLGTGIGMIQPAKVLVIGAGVAGLQAIATAKRLGAVTTAADIRREACEHAKSLGVQVLDLNIPQEAAVGNGGYAKNLSKEWLKHEQKAIKKSVLEADIVILTALVPGKTAPILITEDMVRAMRPGSIIVDISIDQGGNCELTEAGKTIEKYDVLIYGTQNIPGTVAQSATAMFAKNLYNFIENLIDEGQIKADSNDEIIQSTLVTLNGEVVHKGTLESWND